MLTATQIEAMREKVKAGHGRMMLHQQERWGNHNFADRVTEGERDEWLEILDLAAMAARIRER